MAYSKSQITKKINFKVPDGVSSSEMKSEIGEYVIDEILRSVAVGESPVDGYGNFQALSKDYADREKGGDRLANLELDGDMLSAIDWRPTSTGIEVGFFGGTEAAKAYGHNTGMKGHKILQGKAPVRKFIPNAKEKFSSEITQGINEIKKEFRPRREESPFSGGSQESVLTDLFIRDIVGELLGEG